MKVVITDYNTVQLISNGVVQREIKKKRFFNQLEMAIKYNNVSKCTYDLEKNEIIFWIDNDCFCFNLENTNSGIGVTLLNLVKLYEDLEKQRKYEEGLLSDARRGIIKTEEARNFYIKELKKELSIGSNFKKFIDICKDAGEYAKWSNEFDVIFSFVWFGSPIALIIAYTLVGIVLLSICGLSFIWMICSMMEFSLSDFLYQFFKGIITDLIIENSMIRHKIKNVRKIKFSKRDLSETKNLKEVDERIFRIYEKLFKISQDKGITLKEVWTNKMKEFDNNQELRNSVDFMKFLIEFESEIDKLLELADEDKKSYAFTGEPRGLVEVSAAVKTKSKI